MSETGRKMDVEDVLSSIRRLVSEEARSAPDTKTPAASQKPTVAETRQDDAPKGPDKLVLTPSLRVSEALSPTPVAAEIEQRIADIESLVMAEAVESSKEEIARAVELQDTDEDEDYHDDPATQMAELVGAHTQRPQTYAQPVPRTEPTPEQHTAAESALERLDLPERESPRKEPPLSANIAGAPRQEPVEETASHAFTEKTKDSGPKPEDAPVSEMMEGLVSFDFVEAEAPEEDDLDGFDTDALADADDTSDETENFPTHSPFPAQEDQEEPATEEPPQAEGLTATIVERPEPTPEPTAQPDPAPNRPHADSALFDEPVDYTEGEDGFLDEEALREMVSDMVRSELQGELGDRITRNVRKLVRREIHRALASREFE
ncbi:hypothetical protein [Neptunicoccus cionae]|uniref:Uncharacterized protein n=1 Tax=Neptunicoccus cionae TaxID=2035344 RepID=A0A916QTH8_9RHOB|nr:hypothetical protein [Amylibacter cionae]GGA12555.1 hypothetical protein GCM10011498_10550 [Amylibacter cionae]